MRSALRPVVLAIAILGAMPAIAQDDPAPAASEPESTIVVTGKTEPPTRREVFEQALEVSRIDPGQMYEQTLARVTAPVCPAVVGLDDALADQMVARIRANAADLKLRLAGPRCVPNLLVAFVDNGQELLADLAERHPAMFSLIGESEQHEILADMAPVHVWNVVETKWATGAPLAYRHGKAIQPSIRGRVNRLFLPTRKDIDFAVIAYDREAVLGMSVVQLADYATMRGLSHTRPASGDGPMNTILALFDDAQEIDPADRDPAELTSFDLGYLRSVYFWKPEYAEPAVGRLLGVRRRADAAATEPPQP